MKFNNCQIFFDRITSDVSKISMKTFIVQRIAEELEDSSNVYSSEISPNTDNDDLESFDSELDYYFAQSSKPKYEISSMRNSNFTPTMVDYGSDDDNYFLPRKDEYQDLPSRLSHDTRFSQKFDYHYEPTVVWKGPEQGCVGSREIEKDADESSQLFSDLDDIRSRYSNTSYKSESPRPSLATDVLLKTPRTYRKPESPALEPKKSENLPLQKPSLSSKLTRYIPDDNERGHEETKENSKQVLQDSKATMNFVNESGTQINFWGVENAERLLQELQLRSGVPKKSSSARLESSRAIERTVRFEKSFETKSTPPSNNLIQKEECFEQQLPSFLRKFFGFDDSDEEKEKEQEKLEDDRKRRQKRKKNKIKSEKKKKNFIIQDFNLLNEGCIKKNSLWEDETFPPAMDSLYMTDSSDNQRFEWKRPTGICRNPCFISGGASRFDVKQGSLGDCWLLASLACLTTQKKLFERVVPINQNYNSNYTGIFHFNIWQYGKWVEVCVDDKLPVYHNRLVYIHSSSENEFWSALLEKAFAK